MICYDCLDATEGIKLDSQYISHIQDDVCEICQRMQTKIDYPMTEKEKYAKGWPDWTDLY